MAHFAEIDSNGIVKRVLVIPNNQEHRGLEYISSDLGLNGDWVQTSYTGAIRKQFAGIGFIYNKEMDIFICPQPYPSWVLNEDHDWKAPTEQPGIDYYWNEELLSWLQYDL